MAQESSQKDTQDFASLSDAIIPSNIYLKSWCQTDQGRPPHIPSVPLGLNMYTPAFGSAFPSPAITERPMSFSDPSLFNNSAFTANSLQQSDVTRNDQNREVGNALLSRSQTDPC